MMAFIENGGIKRWQQARLAFAFVANSEVRD
jgi:hypothetical protein